MSATVVWTVVAMLLGAVWLVLKFPYFLKWVPVSVVPVLKYYQSPIPGITLFRAFFCSVDNNNNNDDDVGPFPDFKVGNMKQWIPGKMHEKLLEWVLQYGDVYKFYMGPKEVVLVADPSMMMFYESKAR